MRISCSNHNELASNGHPQRVGLHRETTEGTPTCTNWMMKKVLGTPVKAQQTKAPSVEMLLPLQRSAMRMESVGGLLAAIRSNLKYFGLLVLWHKRRLKSFVALQCALNFKATHTSLSVYLRAHESGQALIQSKPLS